MPQPSGPSSHLWPSAREGVDARPAHVDRKRPQALDGVHQEQAAVAVADLADGLQVGPLAAQVLHEADGQQAGAAAGLVDALQGVVDREPLDAHAARL